MRISHYLLMATLPALAASAAFAAPSILPTPEIGKTAARCPDPGLRTTAGRAATGVQKLGDLPPANHYLAVDRQVGGCRKPLIVRTGIGKR